MPQADVPEPAGGDQAQGGHADRQPQSEGGQPGSERFGRDGDREDQNP